MILDTLSNASAYFHLNGLFEKVFEHLSTLNLEQAEPQTIVLEDGNIKINIIEGNLRDASVAQLEIHRRFIDIHIPLSKPETYGWKATSALTQPDGDYNPETDMAFFHDGSTTLFSAMPYEIVIFFPEDGHAPLIGEGKIKKLMIKVAV